ncbi:DNA internalization-related competence protein ComEC/Rec2 [Endozoicomonas sp. G2_1]|uniref:DNA internalization-related competence protein ComEC/Rec2 n=1 Tax=Endozoicomonas sp. G2_1 TaxID=2821091 RepID=UPI001ADCB193|nr:DNA internalization-related competence protein ComEC/Rec2 [Endozoicomonas sp. G2_1]MBO9489017.1 DNA internalization-related competence protein ComEC/Rec2 [Endozoicomonas sp. G2_1]
MERWLLTFFLGAILSLFLPIVPDLFYVISVTSVGIVLSLFTITRLFAALLLGIAVVINAAANLTTVLPEIESQYGLNMTKPVVVVGEILTIPSVDEHGSRFNFRIIQIEQRALDNTFDVRLRWYNPCRQFVSVDEGNHKRADLSPESLPASCQKSYQQAKQGQKWLFKIKIKPSHGFANSGGFSYQTWLKRHQLVATGYVVNELAEPVSLSTSARQSWYQDVKLLLPEGELSGLLLALTFGERTDISPEIWHVLTLTGTQHLIAISGLHIGLIAGFSYFLMSLSLRYLPYQKLLSPAHILSLVCVNRQYFAIVFSMFCALFYAYLAGFALPTQRALIMLSLYWGSRCFAIHLSLTRLLLLTVFIVLLLMPLSIVSASFWLSFSAVSVIFFVFWQFREFVANKPAWLRYLASLLLIQVALSLVMLPISVLLSGHIYPLALVANMVAVPWMSFTSIPLSLAGAVASLFSETLAKRLLGLANTSIELLWQWLTYLAEFDFASITMNAPILTILVILILLYFLKCVLPINNAIKQRTPSAKRFVKRLGFSSSAKLTAISATFLVLTAGVSTYIALVQDSKRAGADSEAANWSVTTLDVGQGLAIVIEQGQQAILYDTGASYVSGFNLAEAVVEPYLLSRGINHLDLLILSHSDNDHAGGYDYLKKTFAIKQVIANHINYAQPCLAGTELEWQQLTLSVLSPEQLIGQDNDDSCVVMISDGKFKLLLPGDISRKIEYQLVANQGFQPLVADLLIAPHHGSKTSSSEAFISAVQPELAIFSTGFQNRWQMPNKAVTSRYQAAHIKTLNTAQAGMIRVEFGQSTMKVQEHRRDLWPYWFAN